MKNLAGRYIIVKNLSFTDFMKDENGDICIYEDYDEAVLTCGMYEFEEALVLEIKYEHSEPYEMPKKSNKRISEERKADIISRLKKRG